MAYLIYPDGQSPLHWLSSEGLIEDLKLTIKKNDWKIDCRDKEERTPLYYAAWTNHVNCIKLLLDNGADINAVKQGGYTALYIACQRNYVEAVEYLLKRGANINTLDRDKGTPLYIAIQERNHQIISLLLNYGANPNISDIAGNPPLAIALNNGDLVSVKLLLRAGAKIDWVNDANKTSVFFALQNEKYLDVLDFLLNYDIDIETPFVMDFSPLLVCAFQQKWLFVKYLLFRGANVHAKANLQGKELSLFHPIIDFKRLDLIPLIMAAGFELPPELDSLFE
eukprot:TRINITY_DN3058_c1_g3_i1.p1 TRINITY_DN3058_c1_g3~~TRINITY_DN3058_c1_g3_i1.p1  ORF type:complete len:281 (+),score=54.78 TRINITY_DN3058_c1_g3_i1:577-1419(+)